ncbi:19364_t:CDS:2, partial [Funneliformis geosporum]
MNMQNFSINIEAFDRITYVDPEKLKDLKFQYVKALDLFNIAYFNICNRYHEFPSLIIYKKRIFNKIDTNSHPINNSEDYNDSDNEITDDNKSNE